MANLLDPMDLKQIITLHLDGTSNRRIGSILGISRNTVNTYMQMFEASGIPLDELLVFENADLSELFSSHTTVDTERHNELMLYFEGVNKTRSHPGSTFYRRTTIDIDKLIRFSQLLNKNLFLYYLDEEPIKSMFGKEEQSLQKQIIELENELASKNEKLKDLTDIIEAQKKIISLYEVKSENTQRIKKKQ
ncbi:Homeodomain-like domain-containing protein [Arcticibacter tournemirensis]|uniref:LuxR C-terminal-related transcriptional regulator n=1 Tax=Arcticibacter tournemirensis TaxID=699437 RepID=UPI001171607C|nr:helix-turn-helix domain-containing protein [Arcticibacter tournemirensis]TQM49666.1 Homeodomain-like domain-containing protein [Arcticibacter tournemirensis]